MAKEYFTRFKSSDYEGPGILAGNAIHPIAGDMFGEYRVMDDSYEPDQVIFLPPCLPQKIICVGLNYAEHAAESTLDAIPEEPLLFFKPPSSLTGHRQPIVRPGWIDRVDYEGEMAVVIGRRMRYVSVAQAEDGIFGYTCVNDVTARNLQKADKQWTRPKGFDTFCPAGPYIVNGIGASSLDIQTRLNGKVVQKSNTSKMIKSPAEVISFISRVMTLYPGDIISTGTPAGIGPVMAGDVVEIEIEKIGILANQVVDE